MKKCPKCKLFKPLSEFHKDKYEKDGHTVHCKSCRQAYGRTYAANNVEKRKVQNKNWHVTNRRKNSAKRKEQRKDPSVRFLHNMRMRLKCAFFGKGKSKDTLSLLGCEIDIARNHVESLFTAGMSWDNYGKWEIDHKIPLASAKSREDLERICYYKNLQPLWKEDNRRKGDRI